MGVEQTASLVPCTPRAGPVWFGSTPEKVRPRLGTLLKLVMEMQCDWFDSTPVEKNCWCDG